MTVAGSSKLLITKMKGTSTRFVDLVDLADRAHTTEGEIQAVCAVIENSKPIGETAVEFAAVFVDNAEKAVSEGVRRRLQGKSIVGRDPAHTGDLHAKDAVLGPFADHMRVVRDTTIFLNIDRMIGIREKAISNGAISSCQPP